MSQTIHTLVPKLRLRDETGWHGWEPATAVALDEPQSVRSRSFMIDAQQKGERVYNDCTHVSVLSSGVILSTLGSFQFIPGYLLSGTNPSHNSVAYQLRNSTVMEAAKAYLSRSTSPEFSELDRFYHRFEPMFSDRRLPREFTIRRDPFDTDFSVWYLLVDLLDAKKLLKSLAKGLFGSVRRYKVPRTYTARDIHDSHLAIRFGVIPTVNDIEALVSTIRSWNDRAKVLAALPSKRYVSHSNLDGSNVTSLLPDGYQEWEETVFPVLPLVGSGCSVKVHSITAASWHGQALYGFACPELQGWVSRLAQICDTFGVLDPAAIWDVVPFSFIVDWFFSVSAWLHKNRPRLFPATAVLHDYLETIKVTTTVTYTLTGEYANIAAHSWPWTLSNSTAIGTEVYTTYLRRRFRPDDGYVKLAPSDRRRDASFVTLANRVAVSAALIGQRVPR